MAAMASGIASRGTIAPPQHWRPEASDLLLLDEAVAIGTLDLLDLLDRVRPSNAPEQAALEKHELRGQGVAQDALVEPVRYLDRRVGVQTQAVEAGASRCGRVSGNDPAALSSHGCP
jgi:hypothetical protein